MRGPAVERRAFLATISAVAASNVGCAHRPHRVGAPTANGHSAADPDGELLTTPDGLIPIDASDPQDGPREAPVVVVVFSDFQCPYCARAASALRRLRRKFDRDVRLVFKHTPLGMHPFAREAATVAEAVLLLVGGDAFWNLHDHLFADQRAIDHDMLVKLARDAGAGYEAIEGMRALAQKRVDDDVALAVDLGLRGAPTIFVNAKRFEGAQSYETLRRAVEDALEA